MLDTKTRQLELIKTIQNDKEHRNAALMELISMNMGYIHKLAYSIHKSSEYEDLVSEGIFGMIEAVYKFDVDSNYTFLTYATFHIKNRMFAYLRSTLPLKVSKDSWTKMEDEAKDALWNTFSFDNIRETIGELNEAQRNTDFERLEETELIQAVREAIALLPEREAMAVRAFYGIGGTRESLTQLSKKLGVSARMCSKYFNNGLKKLKQNKKLESFFRV